MTEQDRELLETAAKAAGHSLVWGEKHKLGDDTIDCTDIAYIRSGQSDDGDAYWNPLEDDGDALRLAVKLGMLVGIGECECCAEAHYPGGEEPIRVRFSSSFPDCEAPDAFSATRLAIVRAAAEIERNKP